MRLLMSNSLKFAAAGRNPRVHIRMKKLSKEEVAEHPGLDPSLSFIQLEWEDNGIGFSPEYAEQVFVIFQRLNDDGITVIVVTHEPDVAEYAQRRILFRDGKVIEDAPVTNRRRAA